MYLLKSHLCLGLVQACLWACVGAGIANAQTASQGNGQAQAQWQGQDQDSPIWKKVRSSLFQARPILSADQDVIALEAPARAEDAATVPIALRGGFAQTPQRYIARIYLVIDSNPSPIAATFHFTPLSGRADIETRVRIEQYTWVRAIAETNDGTLFMATRFVKGSGGCSAPPGKDAQAALASLGRIRLRVEDVGNAVNGVDGSQPLRAQLMLSHPNTSGLVMDQISRLYAPAHFVRAMRVTLDGAPVLSAELDISISENPNFRFFVLARKSGLLRAELDDTQDMHFQASAPVHIAGAPGPEPAPVQPASDAMQQVAPQPGPQSVSQPEAQQIAQQTAQQIAPGVYLLPGLAGEADGANLGRIGNVGFIVGEASVLVINTGSSYRHGQALLQAIRRVTDKPIGLAIVTHTRPEFLLGAGAFQAQGIPVHMQHQAAELMRARCDRCLKKMQTLLGLQAMQGTALFKPDQEFEQATVVEGMGRNIRLLHFGHSSGPGDVAVLDEPSGTLFAGGLLDNHRIPDVQDGDLPGWHSALQSLRALSLVRIVPGHGAAGSVALLDDTGRYLTQLESRVTDLLRQQLPLAAISAAADLPDFASWDGYATIHPRNATAVYLRLERAGMLKP